MEVEFTNQYIQICTINNRKREMTMTKCDRRLIQSCLCERNWCNYPSFRSYTPVFFCGCCYSIFRFLLCRTLFVLVTFFSLSLYCLSFDLRLLVTGLVSSNLSLKQPNRLNTSTIPITTPSLEGKTTNYQQSLEQYNMLIAV